MARLLILGLGPGDPDVLSRATMQALASAALLLCPLPEHPALADIEPARIRSLSAAAAGWDALVANLPADALVLVALPGHPAEHAAITIAGAPPPQILPAPAMRDTLCSAFALPGSHAGLQVLTLDALLAVAPELAAQGYAAVDAPWCEQQQLASYRPPWLPARLNAMLPALIVLRSHALAPPPAAASLEALRAALLARYPASQPFRALRLDRLGAAENQWQGALAALNADTLGAAQALYLPALAPIDDQRGSEGLLHITARLLGPYGCPWDRQQSHQSLRSGLLEEVYEVLEALDGDDDTALAEELGDLLLQVMVHSEMARQAGRFDYGDVLAHISSKLVRRHPHVFGNLAVADDREVLANWEQIKAGERAASGRQRRSALDGIPAGMPALAAAQKMIGRAARTGFDWDSSAQAWAKVEEEIAELHSADRAGDAAQRTAEFGDLLLALTRLARQFDIDAEAALREASARFRRRFVWMEHAVAAQGRTLAECQLPELLQLWQAAKAGSTA